MYPQVGANCPVGDLSTDEIYHASIAYQRPRGNTEPDNDPSSVPSLRPARIKQPLYPVIN
jgi:hypothetical protein